MKSLCTSVRSNRTKEKDPLGCIVPDFRVGIKYGQILFFPRERKSQINSVLNIYFRKDYRFLD